MINLLPQVQKKELQQEETWKLIVIMGIFVVFFLLSLSLILFSIKNYLAGELEVQKITLNQKENELEAPNISGLKEDLLGFNSTLSQLDSFYASQPVFSEVLNKISRTVPEGIVINNLSLSQKGKVFSCSLTGFSPERDLLLGFKDNLEKEGTVKNINFPPGSWVEAKDINFMFSFNIDENR